MLAAGGRRQAAGGRWQVAGGRIIVCYSIISTFNLMPKKQTNSGG